MIQGEGKGIEDVPRRLFEVKNRLCSSIKITSLRIAAKKGFVENKNHIMTATTFLIMVDGVLDEPNTLMKKRQIINVIKEIRMDE
jgi:hypothetical protein